MKALMKHGLFHTTLAVNAALAALLSLTVPQNASAEERVYDVTTLAGKVASLRGTAGLQIRFSALIESVADEPDPSSPNPAAPIAPSFVLSSPLDGTSVAPPNVT